jgi:hypothetical protein
MSKEGKLAAVDQRHLTIKASIADIAAEVDNDWGGDRQENR